ncbi:MAG: hypothetical protein IK066_05815, partial [Kiritimatiellae bacterium]|nr:hypothetical protein [Kiritimatiellia bacterium]
PLPPVFPFSLFTFLFSLRGPAAPPSPLVRVLQGGPRAALLSENHCSPKNCLAKTLQFLQTFAHARL